MIADVEIDFLCKAAIVILRFKPAAARASGRGWGCRRATTSTRTPTTAACGCSTKRASLPSEPELGTLLGVSRTTVRTILTRMEETGLIAWNKRDKTVLREPRPDDFFPEEETDTLSRDHRAQSSCARLLAGGAEAGMQINELELAREIGVGTTSVREFLIRFSRFGLIEKRRNSHWVLKGFTRAFALELTEIREMFELRSAAAFAALAAGQSGLGRSRPIWRTSIALLARDIATRFNEFSELDERFHRLIHRASRNRFIVDFYDVIAMIFHYHYQWNKAQRARAQRGRPRRASRLYRGAQIARSRQGRRRLPHASEVGASHAFDLDARSPGYEAVTGQRAPCCRNGV